MFAMPLVGSATDAAAQTSPGAQPPPSVTTQRVGGWSVTPFIGFGFSGDLDSAAGAFGVAGGYGWSPSVTLEGELNVLPSSETGGVVEANSNAWSLTGNLLYHFAPRAIRPYAVVGLGLGHASADVDTVLGTTTTPTTTGTTTTTTTTNVEQSSTEFVFNFGGGIERAITENIHFRGDLRYFFGGDLVPDYWRLSAGLRFGLGRR
jgi:opacity protein-like surface antigen